MSAPVEYIVDLGKAVGDGNAPPERALISNASPYRDADSEVWNGLGTLEPPYPFEWLWAVYEKSAILRPPIAAMATNIHGHGYRLAPVLDPQSADYDEQIRVCVQLELLASGSTPDVSDADVAVRKELFAREALRERVQAASLLENMSGADVTWLSLCLRTQYQAYVCGNAFWEIVRDSRSVPARAYLLPVTQMRICASPSEYVEIERAVRSTPISFRRERERVKLRKYVQRVDGTETVYFKQFGDSRIMSSATGSYYTSEAAMREREPNARPATEVIHFKPDACDTPQSIYGVPIWISAISEVSGARLSAEVNEGFWSRNGIPEGILAISGGTSAAGLQEKLQNEIRDKEGTDLRWRLAVVCATAQPGTVDTGAQGSQPKIEFINLRQHLKLDDSANYEDSCRKTVQRLHRLPDIAVGNSEESNRAQADAALAMAEAQVFRPARLPFDAIVDKLLMEAGIRHWQYRSNGPRNTDLAAHIAAVVGLSEHGVITPMEARDIVEEVLDVRLDRLWAFWKSIPLAYAKIGYGPGLHPDADIDPEMRKAAETAPFIPLTADSIKSGFSVGDFRAANGMPAFGDERDGKLFAEVLAGAKTAAAVQKSAEALAGIAAAERAYSELNDARASAKAADGSSDPAGA